MAAFTLVEIAIALAIIGFALVAIIGVLPTGLNTQKDNREDTIIGQDAPYLIEAIRNGAVGFDHLSNYIESVTISNSQRFVIHTNVFIQQFPYATMTSGAQIVRALTTPKFDTIDNVLVTNSVVARVRALSSAAVEQPENGEFGFRYLIQCEVLPFTSWLVDTNATNWNEIGLAQDEIDRRKLKLAEFNSLHTNTTELRLRFEWPLLANGKTGNGARTFRTLVSGERTPGRIQPQQFLPVLPP